MIKKPKNNKYETSHARCQICDIRIEYSGCHLNDGSPITNNKDVWYCNCCNYRVKKKLQKIELQKTELEKTELQKPEVQKPIKEQDVTSPENPSAVNDSESEIDLSYFNKYRATLLKQIIHSILENEEKIKEKDFLKFIKFETIKYAESEFEVSFEKIIELAYTVEPPNKISMILEFERIKQQIGAVPTKNDLKNHKFSAEQYEKEFGTMGHLLERLGYDPFYRDSKSSEITNDAKTDPDKEITNTEMDKLNKTIQMTLHLIKSNQKGVYMNDLKKILEATQETMSSILTRVIRVEGISKKEIWYDGMMQDILFKYTEPQTDNLKEF